MLYLKREAQPSVLDTTKCEHSSVLNGFKNDPFFTYLVNLFTYEFSIQMLYNARKSRQKFCEKHLVFYHV